MAAHTIQSNKLNLAHVFETEDAMEEFIRTNAEYRALEPNGGFCTVSYPNAPFEGPVGKLRTIHHRANQ